MTTRRSFRHLAPLWVIVAVLMMVATAVAQPPLRAPARGDAEPTPATESTPAIDPAVTDTPPEPVEFDGSTQIDGLHTPETEEIPWEDVIEELVLAVFPETLEGDSHWGDTTTIAAGFRIRGGRIVPREHELNDGLWQRYSFSLLNPRETFQIWIDEVTSPEPGVYEARWLVQLRARCTTQVAQWTLGVKGFNTSTESDVTIRARVRCRLTLEPGFDVETLRPTMNVHLQLRDLELSLRDIDTRRIGVIGGWVAREMGDGQRQFINAILRSQQDRIRRRIQERIDEQLE